MRLFLKSSALKELTIYAFQTYGITVVNVISAFVLVRIFSKYVYASYGIIFSIVGILNVFLNGGMARLISFQVLKSPLSEEERESLMGYFRWGYLGMSVLFLCCVPFIYFMYGFSITIFTAIAFFVQQFYDVLNLVYVSEVRERALRRYFAILSVLDYSRAVFPVLMAIIFHSLWGYFFGLLVSAGVCVVTALAMPFWRHKLRFYAGWALKPIKSIGAYADHLKQGYGIALESGASTLYLSILILAASRYLSGPDLADLKVSIGYIATLSLACLPVTRWITFHLPQKLERSTRPFSLLMKTSGLGFLMGLIVVFGGVAFGRWLLPFAYGRQYATAVLLIAPASLHLLLTNGLIGMSVFTRKYRLNWSNAKISLFNVLAGSLILFSPIGPTSVFGYALFYGCWVIPASTMMILITYRKINRAISESGLK